MTTLTREQIEHLANYLRDGDKTYGNYILDSR